MCLQNCLLCLLSVSFVHTIDFVIVVVVVVVILDVDNNQLIVPYFFIRPTNHHPRYVSFHSVFISTSLIVVILFFFFPLLFIFIPPFILYVEFPTEIMPRTNPYEWLWSYFYEKDKFHPQDPRLQLVEMLYKFLISTEAQYIVKRIGFGYTGNVYIDVQRIMKVIPFPDFIHVLTTRPNDVTCTLGLALSRLANEKCPYLEVPIIKTPRFYNLELHISFGDVKSNSVGQLISLRGHVIRVSPCKALLTKGSFRCPKCRHDTEEIFDDGIFSTPDICSNSK
jgi:hypothetical protein